MAANKNIQLPIITRCFTGMYLRGDDGYVTLFAGSFPRTPGLLLYSSLASQTIAESVHIDNGRFKHKILLIISDVIDNLYIEDIKILYYRRASWERFGFLAGVPYLVYLQLP